MCSQLNQQKHGVRQSLVAIAFLCCFFNTPVATEEDRVTSETINTALNVRGWDIKLHDFYG